MNWLAITVTVSKLLKYLLVKSRFWKPGRPVRAKERNNKRTEEGKSSHFYLLGKGWEIKATLVCECKRIKLKRWWGNRQTIRTILCHKDCFEVNGRHPRTHCCALVWIPFISTELACSEELPSGVCLEKKSQDARRRGDERFRVQSKSIKIIWTIARNFSRVGECNYMRNTSKHKREKPEKRKEISNWEFGKRLSTWKARAGYN